MSHKVGGGGVLTKTKRVFLISGTANEGYAVCYNFDVVGETAEADTLSAATAITDWCDARRVQVEVPGYDNNMHFAGVVAKESDGVVGPNWILIHEPGSICNIFAAVTADPRDTTVSTKNSAEALTFTIATNTVGVAGTTAPRINGQFHYGGLPGEGTALLLESEASASALIMAELMEGPPSGGVQIIAVTTTTAGVTVIPHGVCYITSLAAAAGVCSLAVIDGKFVGQKLVVRMLAAPINTVKVSGTFATPNLSAEYLSGAALISTGAFSLDAADEFAVLEWAGARWVVLSEVQVT